MAGFHPQINGRFYPQADSQHRDPSFPNHFAGGKPIEHTTLVEMLHQPCAKHLRRCRINNVPVVHRTKVRQVELDDLAAFKIAMRIFRLRRQFKLADQNQHSGQPTLMPRRGEQNFKLVTRQITKLPSHLPLVRHHATKKPIAFAVPTRHSLKEPRQERCLIFASHPMKRC
nr:hypothetical protein [uncultured bacterium]